MNDESGSGKRVERAQDDLATRALDATPVLPAGDSIEVFRREAPPEFKPDDILADRYRVKRFIARGGMGEVYEVEDLTLHGRLALKTIRPEIATNRVAVERFKREINIARRITHPNVSRIYDLGVHHGTSETMFLTMEFLPGETLADRIGRAGRMTEQEALPLVEQICAGLAAAHELGIIHRDFKSANVMLVPASGSRGLRAVVTDFGLARAETSEEGTSTLSEAGMIMGTPAYMAPEQLEGLHLTPAADIYALGVVLYELMTGARPFQGDTPFSLAIKRLTDQPVPPRQLNPALDPVWESCILRCLEREPVARFGSAIEVAAALRRGELQPVHSNEAQTLVVPAAPVPTWSWKSRLTRYLAVLVLMAAALLGVKAWRQAESNARDSVSPAAGPTVSLRRGVAVLGIQDRSGTRDAAWLATAISEMLTTVLGTSESVRVVPGQDVARVSADLRIREFDRLSKQQLDRIGRSLGVQWIVVGSYKHIGDPGSSLLTIDLQLRDAATGKVLQPSRETGTDAEIFDLVSRVAAPIRAHLGLGELSPAQAVEAQASVPANPEAIRYYTEGITRLWKFDGKGALEALKKAAAEDPAHPLIRFRLASAYSYLGDEARALEEAERAVQLSKKLRREQQLQLEARAHEMAGDWEKAIAVEESLWKAFPDIVEYGGNLANSQISADKTKEALVTIGKLRQLPRPASQDPRIDLVEAFAHQQLGDARRQAQLASAAAAKARSSGAVLLLAQARMVEAQALLTLGDLEPATAALDEARSLFQVAGDRATLARYLELTADFLSGQGDLEGERRLLEQALGIYREFGDHTRIADALLKLGTVRLRQGRTTEAEDFFDQSLATYRQMGNRSDEAAALNSIGIMMFNRGDLTRAQEHYQEALKIFSALSEREATAATLSNIGEVLAYRGELEQARDLHDQARAINVAHNYKSGVAHDLFRLGEIFALRGDFAAASERYEQALKIQISIREKLEAAETRLALARLATERGTLAVSERDARAAEEILRTEGAAERSTFALAVLVDLLLAQGKQKEASETAQRAWSLARDSEDRRVRFSVAISTARAMAASRKPADVGAALKILEAAREEAARSRFVVFELEARLAIGELEVASGRADGKKRLQALEKEARVRGFGWIAKRAAGAFLGPSPLTLALSPPR